MHLSVVIPCHNEGRRLPRTLAQLRRLRAEQPTAELVLVDDGSEDGTRAMLEHALRHAEIDRMVVLPVNRGKGRAVAEGVAVSTGALVLVSDADLSTPLEQRACLADAIAAGADLAIGIRRGPGARIGQPSHRRLMGAAFSALTRAALLPGIEDSQCGFKMFRGDVARALFTALQIDGFAFDVEILRRARWLGLCIEQIPVAWRDRDGSTVSPIRHSTQMLRDLLRIRLLPLPRPLDERSAAHGSPLVAR